MYCKRVVYEPKHAVADGDATAGLGVNGAALVGGVVQESYIRQRNHLYVCPCVCACVCACVCEWQSHVSVTYHAFPDVHNTALTVGFSRVLDGEGRNREAVDGGAEGETLKTNAVQSRLARTQLCMCACLFDCV